MNRTDPSLRNALLVGVVLGSSLALAIWLFGLGCLSIPLVIVQEREVIGGNWEVVYVTSTLGHPSTTQRLIRRRGPVFSTMATYLSSMQYLGDNCISYEVSTEEGRSIWAACDFNAPVELYKGFGRGIFAAEGLIVEEFVQGNLVAVRTLSFPEIKVIAGGR